MNVPIISMPAIVERIEPRIYLSHYSGDTTSEEIQEVIQKREALADEFNEDYYVSLADLTGIISFPLDLASLRSIGESDPRNIGFLLVGGSLQLRVLVESVSGITQVKIEFFKTLEEALVRARVLLEGRD